MIAGGRVPHTWQHADGSAAGANLLHGFSMHQETGIVPRVHNIQRMLCRVQLGKNRGYIAAPRLGSLRLMHIVQPCSHLFQRKARRGHGAKCRAKRATHQRGGQALTGNIGDDHHQFPRRLGQDIQVISANFIACLGAASQTVTRYLWHGLRKQASLNIARGGQVLLNSLEIERAFMVSGVLNGNRRLHG